MIVLFVKIIIKATADCILNYSIIIIINHIRSLCILVLYESGSGQLLDKSTERVYNALYYCNEFHNLLYLSTNIWRVLSTFTAEQVPTKSVWDFGGTWSSKLAGVRFVVDTHSTVGIDNTIPVKVLDMPAGTKSNGFLNKDWMAKASAQYGRLGPVSLSAINRADRNVAVFIGNSRFKGRGGCVQNES